MRISHDTKAHPRTPPELRAKGLHSLAHQLLDPLPPETSMSNQGFLEYLGFHLQLQRAFRVLEIAAAAAESVKRRTRRRATIGMRPNYLDGLGKRMVLSYLRHLDQNAFARERVPNERDETRRPGHHVTPVSHRLDVHLDPVPDGRPEVLG
jgi:hypothetical protein